MRNKENNVFKDALGVKGLGFKLHGNHGSHDGNHHGIIMIIIVIIMVIFMSMLKSVCICVIMSLWAHVIF